jgi:hypothetical protein
MGKFWDFYSEFWDFISEFGDFDSKFAQKRPFWRQIHQPEVLFKRNHRQNESGRRDCVSGVKKYRKMGENGSKMDKNGSK